MKTALKTENRFTKTSKQILFISSIVLGLVLDYNCFYYDWAFHYRITFFQAINFTVSIPLFMYLLILILNRTKIKSKFAITSLSGVFGFICLIFTTVAFNSKGGSQINEVIYLVGFFPAVLTGIIYGLYVSHTIDSKPYEWPVG